MKSKVFFVVTLFWVLFISTPAPGQDEQITLSTYYPAPYGEYDELCAEKLLVDTPDAAELQDMVRGDCHITRSLIVGSGAVSDFSYDRLNTLGTPLYDGDVIIKGNVGIGTTGPGARLQVRGVIEQGGGSGIDPLLVEMYDGLGSSYPIIRCRDTGDIFLRPYPAPPGNFDLQAYNSLGVAYTLIRLQNSTTSAIPNLQLQPGGGNVGIGTTNPGAPLTIKADDSTTMALQLIDRDTNEVASISWFSTGLTEEARINNYQSNLRFYTGSPIAESMRITASGNVGIGTTNPGAKLEVNGTMKIFGTRADRVLNTIYQAGTDGFLVAIITYSGTASSGYIYGYADTSSSPTTIRASAAATYWSGIDYPTHTNSFTMPVRKDEYYRVARTTVAGTAPSVTIYWVPLGL